MTHVAPATWRVDPALYVPLGDDRERGGPGVRGHLPTRVAQGGVDTVSRVTPEPRRRRPRLVMITGHPGSGKSTLGRDLAGALRVPYMSRDDVRWGLRATAGLWTNDMHSTDDRGDAVEAFLQLVEKAAALGISAVLEFIVLRDRPESLERLTAVADCVIVVATATDARARAARRDLADPLLSRPSVLAALGHPTVESYIAGPGGEIVRSGMVTDFALPTMTVHTDDGYDPPLPQVVEWVIDRTQTDG